MKRIGSVVVLIVLTGFALGAGGGSIKVSSSAFTEGGNIPPKFTCDGEDTSPPLKTEGIPENAKAVVMIVDDPDAPGGLFNHWLVWNIDPKTTSLEEGKAPAGVTGTNDFGKSAYGGPCPPSGSHRYSFKVFALDQQLQLRAGAKRKEVDAAIKGHVIGQGELMGRYSKHK